MVKTYGIQWHLEGLSDFQSKELRSLQKPSQVMVSQNIIINSR